MFRVSSCTCDMLHVYKSKCKCFLRIARVFWYELWAAQLPAKLRAQFALPASLWVQKQTKGK